MPPGPVKVLLVDDHPAVREGLRHFLPVDGLLEIVGEAGAARQAVAVGRASSPDVVLLDLGLPDVEGAAAVEVLAEGLPGVPILVLSGLATADRVRACFEAGATGFLGKGVDTSFIREGLRLVAGGQRVVDPSLVLALLDDPAADLTPREVEVLEAVSRGLTNRGAARLLGTTENTIKTHLSRAMSKLGAQDRTHAVAMVMRRGLLR